METPTYKTLMICTSQSGETATYEPSYFNYDILTIPGTDNKSLTKASFRIYLEHNPDPFLLKWKSKNENEMDCTIKMIDIATDKITQTLEMKNVRLLDISGATDPRISIQIEAKSLTIDGIEIDLN